MSHNESAETQIRALRRGTKETSMVGEQTRRLGRAVELGSLAWGNQNLPDQIRCQNWTCVHSLR